MSALPVSLASLLGSMTESQLLQKSLVIARRFGLTTESWQSGDPTLTMLRSLAARLAEWEDQDTGFPAMIAGVILGLSKGEWLTELLHYNYNVDRVGATYATCTLQLTNTTAADFGTLDPDDITAENTATGATFRNEDGFTLGPSGSLTAVATVTIKAETAGSSGNSDVGDINALVTVLDGVTVTNLTAATGFDEESDDAATGRGEAKLESLSPNGPRGAYRYAATTPALQTDGSNQTNVTRTRVIEDSDYGVVVVFVAGDSGEVASGDADKALTTIEKWANPFVIDPLVVAAANKEIDVVYTLYVYDDVGLTSSQIQTAVTNALRAAIKTRQIGGDALAGGDVPGVIFTKWIEDQIVQTPEVSGHAFRCDVTSPAADVALDLTTSDVVAPSADVAVFGTITGTVNIVEKAK